jgi:hypothetical protein
MVAVACVWVGTGYGVEYVQRLRNMVRRHLRLEHRFICLTDKPETHIDGVDFVDIRHHKWPGWWSKMALFDPALRGMSNCVYFDLDTVIVGDITPLFDCRDFAICENFTRAAGHPTYPCSYGSCVMYLPLGFGRRIFQRFEADADALMARHAQYGDQRLIEEYYPFATRLQRVMPRGFFVGRREFSDGVPPDASVMVFAGPVKPHNTAHPWVQEHWR